MKLETFLEKNNEREIKAGGFSIRYNCFDAAEKTVKVIFNDNSPYKFVSKTQHPTIIDVGSGIGISTLYFKSIYPQATVLCFEPDNKCFETLQENIAKNRLENIELFNHAISKKEGNAKFFGQLFSDSADNRGSSLVEEWACQRKENDFTEVATKKLSDYINKPIDFLKLDAVGFEEQILEELEDAGKLSLISEIAIEMYQATRIKSINSLPRIFAILKHNNFEITINGRDSSFLLKNEDTRQWTKRAKPLLFTIRALSIESVADAEKEEIIDQKEELFA